MRRLGSMCLFAAMLLLVVPVCVFARGKGIDTKELLGYGLGGAGGFLAALFTFLPLMLKLVSAVKSAQKQTETFVKKWRGKFEDDMKRDFRILLVAYDNVFERGADLLQRLQMRRAARVLRGIITQEMMQ